MISLVLTLRRMLRAILFSWHDQYFRSTLFMAMLMLISGTLFYRAFEGWSMLDSLYFCVMTLTTVGYGDLIPTSTISKVFTMIYSVIGIGVFVALLAQLAKGVLKIED